MLPPIMFVILLLVLVTVHCEDFSGEDEMKMEEGFAQASQERQNSMGGVICHSGMISVQSSAPIVSDGCTGSELLEMMSGGEKQEEDFTYCCDLHDVCYQTCGVSRKQCDVDFKRCMSDMCTTTYADNEKCPSTANLYYMGTSSFGVAAYEDSQSEHCQCIDIRIKNVRAHYEKLIVDFYQAHAPESLHKFDMTKYEAYKGSPHKWGWFYYSLHSKYDIAIRHEGKRVALGQDVPRPTSRSARGAGAKDKKKKTKARKEKRSEEDEEF